MTSLILAGLLAAAIAWLLVREGRHRAEIRRRDRELGEARRDAGPGGGFPDSFFDMVTHEIRAPVSAILGYQELLADGAYGELDERAREPVATIGRSARHLLHLTDGVIELARLRTGTARLDFEPLELGVLVSTVADSFRAHARERGVPVEVSLPDALPVALTDRDRLIRMFDLIITSVVKHPAGDRPLTLHVSREDGGVSARLEGMAIEVRPDADDSVGRYGVRLASARATARLLGGRLEIDADPDGVARRLELRIALGPAEEGG